MPRPMPAPLMHHTTAMAYWRTLQDVVRRADVCRMALSRLDAVGLDGSTRQSVESELAALQDELASIANRLTVHTLQAETTRLAARPLAYV